MTAVDFEIASNRVCRSRCAIALRAIHPPEHAAALFGGSRRSRTSTTSAGMSGSASRSPSNSFASDRTWRN